MKKSQVLLFLALCFVLLNNCTSNNDSFLSNIQGSYSLNEDPYIILSIYQDGNMFTNNNIIFKFENSIDNYSAIYQNIITYNYYPVRLCNQNLLMGENYFSKNQVLFKNMTLFGFKQN